MIVLNDEAGLRRVLGQTEESAYQPLAIRVGGGPTQGRATYAEIDAVRPGKTTETFRVEGDLFAQNRTELIRLAGELERA